MRAILPRPAMSGSLVRKLIDVHVVVSLKAQVDVPGLECVHGVPQQGQGQTAGYQFPVVNKY